MMTSKQGRKCHMHSMYFFFHSQGLALIESVKHRK